MSSTPASDSVIHNERLVSATPRQIFAAIENPELLARWWGPNGFTNTIEQFEFKPGGRWKLVMHGPNGANYPNESVFGDIQPDARVVIEHQSQPVFTLTINLTPKGSQTHVTWDQDFKTPEIAAQFRPMCDPANEQNLDRLEVVLASEKGV